MEPNVTTLQSCPERHVTSQRLSWNGDSSLRLCEVFGESTLSVILLTTVPITCVLCVPLRSRLFFRSCCYLVSNSTHRTALCLQTEFSLACCCVLKPCPLLVLFLLLPARSCLERRWGLARLRLWAPHLRRPWFTSLVGEAQVRPERFQGASSKVCS